MIEKDKIIKLAEEKLIGTPNFIVDITISKGNKITVLIDSDSKITIQDCVEMSRFIENSIDRTLEDFELNVMSAGLTEPLKIVRQYYKNVGKQVSVVTKENQKYVGTLLSVTDETIVIETKRKEKLAYKKGKQLITNNIEIAINQIKETRIIVSF